MEGTLHLMRTLLSLVLLATSAASQGAKSFARVDPFTKSDPEIIAKAGYASFGPFRLGDDHTTDQVEKALEGVPLIWVETAHFKLGSGLPEYTLPSDDQEKRRIQAELERLGKKLPDVKAKPKKLDPWLRLHLMAQRLEDTYTEFLAQFGLKETDFPSGPLEAKAESAAGPYMGTGRFLGMPAKYTVLVFDKKQHLERYTAIYFGQKAEAPLHKHLTGVGALFYGTAAEFLTGEYDNDTALTCALVWGVTQDLAAGFRGAETTLPFVWSEGLGHWFARRTDPRFHFFSGADPAKNRITDEWNWALGVRARVERKVFPSTEAMLAWNETDALEWADHLVLWSRVDFLMSREDGAAGKLLRRLKEPAAEGAEESGLARSQAALLAAVNLAPAQFDEAWSEWVLKTYPVK